MPHASPAGRVVRFGVFEVDLAAGELRKSGRRIRLQEQPFQILALLLERPGEVITREEVRQKLWPADTFVDFDHSLNTAINKVREALGDSASSPRYVETLARRGYRFLAPVERAENPAMARSASGPQAEAEIIKTIHPELEVPVPRRGLTRGLFGAMQLMYLIFYVVALFRWRDVDEVAAGLSAGVGIVRHRGGGAGDGGGGDPPPLLSDFGDRFRLPAVGRKIPTDVPVRSGARPALGGGAVSAGPANRIWRCLCRDSGAALCTLFRANADQNGIRREGPRGFVSRARVLDRLTSDCREWPRR